MTGPTREEVERHDHWAVTVSASGEHIITLEPECYGGREPSSADEDAIRTAAHHLLSFIGDDTPAALRERLEAAEAERDAAARDVHAFARALNWHPSNVTDCVASILRLTPPPPRREEPRR